MKYVLDSNIALKWVLPEPDSATAKKLRYDFEQAIHELVSVDSFRQGRVASLITP